ncbi:MAG: guanylate kinase [Epsilonproteobacteria bacterium]|nr:guanylate kinase [Campylobacterota bacterium]
MKGAILVISGPSGAGKSTLINRMLKEVPDTYFSISTTTREMREGEQNGREYFFISKEQFEKEIEEGEFLEWAKVHGNYYGTSLKPVKKALSEGKLVVFDIDVQGHKIVREKFDKITTSVFLTTPSLNVLKERLSKRGTDSKDIIEKRIKNALVEIKEIGNYDFLIINDDLEKACDSLISVAKSARLKTSLFDLEQFIDHWINN